MSTIFCVDRVIAHNGALLRWVLTEMFVVQNCILFGTTNRTNRKSISREASVLVRKALSAIWQRAIGDESKAIDEAGVAFLQFARGKNEEKAL